MGCVELSSVEFTPGGSGLFHVGRFEVWSSVNSSKVQSVVAQAICVKPDRSIQSLLRIPLGRGHEVQVVCYTPDRDEHMSTLSNLV